MWFVVGHMFAFVASYYMVYIMQFIAIRSKEQMKKQATYTFLTDDKSKKLSISDHSIFVEMMLDDYADLRLKESSLESNHQYRNSMTPMTTNAKVAN